MNIGVCLVLLVVENRFETVQESRNQRHVFKFIAIFAFGQEYLCHRIVDLQQSLECWDHFGCACFQKILQSVIYDFCEGLNLTIEESFCSLPTVVDYAVRLPVWQILRILGLKHVDDFMSQRSKLNCLFVRVDLSSGRQVECAVVALLGVQR